MIPPRRFVALLAGACLLTGRAAEIRLPPITGELSGDFKPLQLPGAPALHWNAAVSGSVDDARARVIEAKIAGEGTLLRATVNLATLEEGTWRLADGELDLSTWVPVLADKIADAMKELVVTGKVRISGEGAIHAGQPAGTVTIAMNAERVESPTGGWSLQRVAFTGEFGFAMEGFAVKSTKPFELTVGAIGTSRFGARNVFVRGLLNADRTIVLQEARVEIAGGDMTLELATASLSPFAVDATVHIVNVGLQDLVALVPSSLTEARGRIDGTVRLGWSSADGIKIGAGELGLNRSEPAVIRLAPTPGSLTVSMPKRFDLLPAWTGSLGRRFSADNPIYHDLEEIEMGRALLTVDSLVVKLTPEGDDDGHTATVRLRAHPSKVGASVKTLRYDVNLAGSLDSILSLGMNSGLSITAH